MRVYGKDYARRAIREAWEFGGIAVMVIAAMRSSGAALVLFAYALLRSILACFTVHRLERDIAYVDITVVSTGTLHTIDRSIVN